MARRNAHSDEFVAEEVQDLASMDPRLQRMVVKRRSGQRKPSSASTAEDEVAVIAKVSDLSKWEDLSEVRVGQTIGARDEDGTWIVTARIPVSRIEFVRTRSFVKSLKAGQPVRPTLDATLPDIGAIPAHLPAIRNAREGRGVVLGVVDYGCAFAHNNFLTPNGRTRLLALWDQTSNRGLSPRGYGTQYSPSEINAALRSTRPYAALNYGPDAKEAAHGTHVMDIAAGNGRGSGFPGVAPGADLVFVEVGGGDVPDSGEATVGSTFGDSVQVLEAVKFVFDIAGDKPAVVNLSLGTNGGPHDGTTLVEQGLDRLLRERPNRTIVVAASNSYSDDIHASGLISPGASADVRWRVSKEDSTENELEVWYGAEENVTAEIIAPDGRSLASVGPGKSVRVVDGRNRVVLFATNRLRDPGNGDNVLNIWQAGTVPPGVWIVRLLAGATSVRFHAWIERDDYAGDVMQSRLDTSDSSHTLGTLSCGHLTIAVGSYDARKASKPLSYFSSSGPTRDGRQKPELSAPGHGVRAASSLNRSGVAVMSGTSMAAPAVAGAAALLLAAAAARGKSLTAQEVRSTLISTARSSGSSWHARYGHGRLDVAAALKALKPKSKPATRRSTKPARVKADSSQLVSVEKRESPSRRARV